MANSRVSFAPTEATKAAAGAGTAGTGDSTLCGVVAAAAAASRAEDGVTFWGASCAAVGDVSQCKLGGLVDNSEKALGGLVAKNDVDGLVAKKEFAAVGGAELQRPGGARKPGGAACSSSVAASASLGTNTFAETLSSASAFS